MSVRRATANDFAAFLDINSEVQHLHATAMPLVFKPVTDEAFIKEWYLSVIHHAEKVILVEEEEGVAVGYIYLQFNERPETPFVFAQKLMYIHQIGVRQQHQHQGYGEKLIEAALQLAHEHGIQHIELDTWAFNRNAHEFFARQGFQPYNYRMYLDDPIEPINDDEWGD